MRFRGAALVLMSLVLLTPPPVRAADCTANVMIVLDRSCSMRQPPSAREKRSKWELALEAIGLLVKNYEGLLGFVLATAPLIGKP